MQYVPALWTSQSPFGQHIEGFAFALCYSICTGKVHYFLVLGFGRWAAPSKKQLIHVCKVRTCACSGLMQLVSMACPAVIEEEVHTRVPRFSLKLVAAAACLLLL